MSHISISELRASRKALGNPYAHLEQLEELNHPIRRSRLNLASQYAHIFENGYSALSPDGQSLDLINTDQEFPNQVNGAAPVKKRRSDKDIQKLAHSIHRQIWNLRDELWEGGAKRQPLDMLDPAVAFKILGYDFKYVEGLGQMRTDRGISEIGAWIDNPNKKVRVGRQFKPAVTLFTAAHELGHAVLHPEMANLHRDIPVDGNHSTKDTAEVEANRFATYFLMPEKLVREIFKQLFLCDAFQLNDENSFALSGMTSEALIKRTLTRRGLSRMLAGAIRFNGKQLTPIHQLFRVSRETMAIRLEELNLVPAW